MKVIGEDIFIDNTYFKKEEDNSINNLPLDNLAVTYIPLYYQNSDYFKKNLKDNISTISDEECNKLYSDISNLNKKYKVYNKNIINFLLIPVMLIWLFIFFLILRFLYIKLNIYYSYILLFIIIILFIAGSLWTLYINNL